MNNQMKNVCLNHHVLDGKVFVIGVMKKVYQN